MPLSKIRNRDRMRQARLHNKVKRLTVQPKTIADNLWAEFTDTASREGSGIIDIDADGNPVYE